MTQWKIFLIIGALACGFFISGGSVQAGCCKKIIINSAGDWDVQAVDISETDCNKSCDPTTWVKGRCFYRANATVSGDTCSPEAGCCMVNISSGGQWKKFSFLANNDTECLAYRIIDSAKNNKYYAGWVVKGDECVSSLTSTNDMGCCKQECIDPNTGVVTKSFNLWVTKKKCNELNITCPTKFYPEIKGVYEKCEKPLINNQALPPVTPKVKSAVVLKAVKLTNPLSTGSLTGVIRNIINSFLSILGAIALAMFVYGGFTWLTAAGNDKRIEAGRGTLLWAAIGLILIFLSYILVGFVLQAIGVV